MNPPNPPIRPCPFCGAPAEIDTRRGYRHMTLATVRAEAAIYCTPCNVMMSMPYDDFPEISADEIVASVIINWNQRSMEKTPEYTPDPEPTAPPPNYLEMDVPSKEPHLVSMIEHIYTYHSPSQADITKYTELRNKGKEFAFIIAALCPPSTERADALTKLREVVMWANASIACNPKIVSSDREQF